MAHAEQLSSLPGLEVALRPSAQVMSLPRLGSMYQTRLSFVRSLVRQMIRERWRVETKSLILDDDGYGDAIYQVQTPGGRYQFVAFSRYLDPDLRSDRVIAQQWDLAFALCEGEISEGELDELRINVPRQEAGRCSARVLTLSRANRSLRNFEAVIERLATGVQPDAEWFEHVGYLYRTTAVYGNGKFGLADYERLRHGRDFARPFSAQMFTVFMVRHFTLAQVEHIARRRAPATAVDLKPELKRYIGIGNSTGLGMAPFLVRHPLLIDRWVHVRENALARVFAKTPNATEFRQLAGLVDRAGIHMRETHTGNATQASLDRQTRLELSVIKRWLARRNAKITGMSTNRMAGWQVLVRHAKRCWSLQTQELVNSLLLEIYPDAVNNFEDDMSVDAPNALDCSMSLSELKTLIEGQYDWVLAYDFADVEEQRLFWYRAANKEEPRLGERDRDAGVELEIRLDIARAVRHCYDDLCGFIDAESSGDVVDFLLDVPEHRGIVRRIQNVGLLAYGEIRANLVGRDCRPLDLLRCKLSFFGASKFDPRSDRWVRITLFQGAPLVEDLAEADEEYDWFLPTRPNIS